MKTTISEMLEDTQDYESHFNDIDFHIVQQEICKCGKHRVYRGFIKNHNYQAFSICEKCNVAEEF